MARARGGAGRGSGPPGEPRLSGYLYLLPGFLVYAAFLLYPLGRAAQFSLYEWDGASPQSTFVGLRNYAEILGDPTLRASFGHALVLMFFYAVLPLLIGLPLATILNRAKVRGLGFFRTVVFLPQVIAMVVIAVAWRRLYAPEGGLNDLLRLVGLDSLARGWLGDYTWALPAVGVIGTWFETGLVTVLLLSGMGRIPGELYEAARLDGAGPIREFFAVTLPSVRGEIAVALTLTVIAALRTFDLVYVTTSGGPGTTTMVPSFEVYNRAFEQGNVGSATAIGVTLTVVIFLISTVINRIGDRGTA
ncbi:carbohydrate ABC transporter permease [Actinomycetota bacterium]